METPIIALTRRLKRLASNARTYFSENIETLINAAEENNTNVVSNNSRIDTVKAGVDEAASLVNGSNSINLPDLKILSKTVSPTSSGVNVLTVNGRGKLHLAAFYMAVTSGDANIHYVRITLDDLVFYLDLHEGGSGNGCCVITLPEILGTYVYTNNRFFYNKKNLVGSFNASTARKVSYENGETRSIGSFAGCVPEESLEQNGAKSIVGSPYPLLFDSLMKIEVFATSKVFNVECFVRYELL